MSKNKGLKEQLNFVFGISLTTVIALAVFSVFLTHHIQKQSIENTHLNALGSTLGSLISKPLQTYNYAEVQRLLTVAHEKTSAEFILITPQNDMLASDFQFLSKVASSPIEALKACSARWKQSHLVTCVKIATEDPSQGTEDSTLIIFSTESQGFPATNMLVVVGVLSFCAFFLIFLLSRKVDSLVANPLANMIAKIKSEASLIDPTDFASASTEVQRLIDVYNDHMKTLDAVHERDLKLERQEVLLANAKQVAHDIRSPLTALKTLAGIDHVSVQDQKALLNHAIERIQKITDDLLLTARIKGIFDVDLNKVIARIVEEKRIQFPTANLRFVPGGLQLIRANESDLERVISNVINNAIESNSHSQVDIRTTEESHYHFLHVTDNGQGFREDFLSKLGREPMTSKPDGNGLGLFDAHNKIKSWNGIINLLNVASGGACVKIGFPKL